MEKSYQFETIIQGEPKFPKRDTFMEAWNDMFIWVNEQLKRDDFSLQVLETCIWIKQVAGGTHSPINFYDARDQAIECFGWTKPAE